MKIESVFNGMSNAIGVHEVVLIVTSREHRPM